MRRSGGDRRSEDEIGRGPARMLGHRLHDRRHQHRQGRPVARDGGERRVRREARMDRHGGAELQRRRGLDVEAADMEERQHGEDVIVRGQAVHVLAHHAVPQQRLLPQHRALGPPGGAGGVDDQQRAAEVGVRVAAIAAARRQQRVECGASRRREIEPDDAGVRQTACPAAGRTAAKACSTTSTFTDGIGQDEQLLGHREPPVQRHQHGAEPRAGIEQHQIVGMVQAEDRDAVAAADAEFVFSARAVCGDARARTRHSSAPRPRRWIAGLSGVNAALRVDEVGEVHCELSRPSRRARTAPRGRCGRGRVRRSTAASASRSGCRDRCAPAAAIFSIAWPPQVRIARRAISLAPSITVYCAA